ncbi:MAG: DUF1841 family protein [Actinomycetota bacterium]
MTALDQRNWLFPPRTGTMRGIDLSALDPADEDDRRLLIEAEHPELRSALDRGAHEITLRGQVVNPQLHLAMHEVVANQVWDDDPPQVWIAAQRLLAAGYDRHDILHMLASAVSGEVWSTLHEGEPHDRDRYLTALDALPGSSFAAPESPRPNRHQRRQLRQHH